ncbi:hypothetical protein [Ornithinimicrobium sufpigmenti]|uniref:hypothetical protein n=1 Tax=Ornithinimicrobium sufpigmenti TaxID=2508882 RepID=UPI001036F1B2|nr:MULTISPECIES: hypothetical protein [unclassified Ornithinimicrobium]
MHYRFGRDWNSFTGEPIDEISEEQVRERWEKGPAFSVSRIGDGHRVPDWTLIVRPGGDYLKVSRYDENGSTVEVRHFSEEEGGDGVFLSQLTTYVYEDADRPQSFSEAVAHKIWQFWPDGRARCRETITSQPQARVTEYRDVDVSPLWVGATPTFGDWDRWGDLPDPQTAPPTTT